MSGFTKLSSSIITSSIWVESDTTLRVWIAMLATANANGIVEGAPPGIASLARVTLEACLEALKTLSSPDQYSRSPENEGRRIEVIPGGWQIVNYLKYREKEQEKPGSRAAYYRKYRSSKNGPEEGDCCEMLRATGATGKALRPQQKKLRDTQKQKAEGEEKKSSVADAPVSPEHNLFIEGWCESFEAQHERKYIFQGGRDAKAVQSLLSRTRKPASELLGIATAAWSKLTGFLAEQAVTICGFASKINEIQEALSKPNGELGKSAPTKETPRWALLKELERVEKDINNLIPDGLQTLTPSEQATMIQLKKSRKELKSKLGLEGQLA